MKFMFSGTMLRFVDYASELEFSAPNLDAALQALLAQIPSLRPVLLDGNGNPRRTHQMFLNGQSVEPRCYLDVEARCTLSLDHGDTIYFLTAIAGG